MSEESMSRELEVVRNWNRRLSARDPEAFELLAADFVYRPIRTFTDSQERHGPDAFREFLREWWDSWDESANWELTTTRVYGNAVVALFRFHGRARASGLETVGGVFQVFRFRAGQITSIEDFTDSEDAIAVAEGAE
jgi:ketosteroid isomerase-like protein